MAIMTVEQRIEFWKQRPKEYEGGYIYVPVASKAKPTSSAKAALRRFGRREKTTWRWCCDVHTDNVETAKTKSGRNREGQT